MGRHHGWTAGVALAFCLAAKVSANAANDAMQQLKPAEDTSNAPEGFPPAPPPRSGDEDAPQSAEASAGRVCADYSGYGFYPGPSTPMKSVLSKGNPSGLQFLPPTISYCEYEQLTIDCVDRINMYRSGELKFSNGQADPGRATRALAADTGNMRCSANQAMGDLFQNVKGDGGCDGAHYTAFHCPQGGTRAQNSCCARGGGSFGSSAKHLTYASVKAELFSCLQGMWDEGQDPNGAVTGHWETMRSSSATVVACGFAWDANGRVMMNQDFGMRTWAWECGYGCKGNTQSSLPVGSSDYCTIHSGIPGRTCKACSGSVCGGGALASSPPPPPPNVFKRPPPPSPPPPSPSIHPGTCASWCAANNDNDKCTSYTACTGCGFCVKPDTCDKKLEMMRAFGIETTLQVNTKKGKKGGRSCPRGQCCTKMANVNEKRCNIAFRDVSITTRRERSLLFGSLPSSYGEYYDDEEMGGGRSNTQGRMWLCYWDSASRKCLAQYRRFDASKSNHENTCKELISYKKNVAREPGKSFLADQ